MNVRSGMGTMMSLALVAGSVAVLAGCEGSQQKSGSQNKGASQQKSSAGQQKSASQQKSSGAQQKSSTQNKGAQQKSSGQQQQAKPAPAPAPAEAKPAPAPAPAPVAAPAPMSGSGAEMAFPTGDRATSAILLRQVSPAQVRAGSEYDMEIQVINLTNGTLQNVNVTNTSVSNMAMVSSNPAAMTAGNGVMWNVGDLAAKETKVIKIKAKANAVGMASNCLNVNYNNTLCAKVNVVQPALAITKSMTPGSGLVCDPVSMTITVKNTGTGEATNVVVTDNLPDGLTTVDGAKSVSIPMGTLAAGAEGSRTVALKGTRAGKFDNNASVTADGGLSATSNTVSTALCQPALTVACSGGGNVYIGRNTSFCFTVKNTSDCAASNVVLNVPVANGQVVSSDNGGSAAGNGVSWNLGTLAAGQEKKVCVTVKPTGATSLNATVTAGCTAPASTSCGAVLVPVPDIGTSIDDFTGVRTIGENHEYTFVVKNQGQTPLTNIKVAATLDAGTEFVSSTLPGATVAGKAYTFNVGDLAVGAEKSFVIVVKTLTAGEHRIDTVTSVDQMKQTVRNDEQFNSIPN